LVKCPNCGQFDIADKKVILMREIALLEKKMNEKREELALIESDLTNPS